MTHKQDSQIWFTDKTRRYDSQTWLKNITPQTWLANKTRKHDSHTLLKKIIRKHYSQTWLRKHDSETWFPSKLANKTHIVWLIHDSQIWFTYMIHRLTNKTDIHDSQTRLADKTHREESQIWLADMAHKQDWHTWLADRALASDASQRYCNAILRNCSYAIFEFPNNAILRLLFLSLCCIITVRAVFSKIVALLQNNFAKRTGCDHRRDWQIYWWIKEIT